MFIKRDDLIHPFISGNKWRKLKYTLAAARKAGKYHLVSFGGPYSNHLHALAYAAKVFGFKSTGIVRGETVSNSMLEMNRNWGMNLVFANRTAYRDRQTLFEQHAGHDPEAFFVDEGGAGETGMLGCEEIIYELEESYDHIFCAVGTGTTLRGLVSGIAKAGKIIRAEGICVLKGAEKMDEDWKRETSDYRLHHRFHEGGYAKHSPQLLAFMKSFYEASGIELDHVYTGKMMKAICTLAAEDYFKPGASVLCLHTGGLFGLSGLTK